jgi:hypothetical protein
MKEMSPGLSRVYRRTVFQAFEKSGFLPCRRFPGNDPAMFEDVSLCYFSNKN